MIECGVLVIVIMKYYKYTCIANLDKVSNCLVLAYVCCDFHRKT